MKRYNPLKETRYTVAEFLDFAVSRGWNRERAARDVYSMLAHRNVTGAYHITLRNTMREFAEQL